MHRPGIVDIEDGWIVQVSEAHLAGPEDGAEVINLPGLLLPGLVNVHCHSPMTLFRGAAEDISLDGFLRQILWPREARLDSDDVYWGMTLGCAELLRCGVTTTCEMYFFEQATARAAIDAGLRCLVTPGILEVDGASPWGSWQDRLRELTDFHAEFDGAGDLIEVGFAAHSAYSLPLDALTRIAGAARDRGALVHIHLAETKAECDQCQANHQTSVPKLLAGIGFFDGRTLAAHCVWLDDEDIAVLKEYGVGVAHCPQSNAKLASGVARLADLLQAGLSVGLGTDGPASNNDLDLWQEMQFAALVARIAGSDPGAITAPRALAMATRGGADALGRSDIGVLAPGRRADLIHVRTDDPTFVPVLETADLASHLLWSASSRLVEDVWVGGRQVVADGAVTTVDLERASREVQIRAARLSDPLAG